MNSNMSSVARRTIYIHFNDNIKNNLINESIENIKESVNRKYSIDNNKLISNNFLIFH